MEPIYLDYNATTPVDPAVVDAMLPYLTVRFGNASSAHQYGSDAHHAMDRAREQVATMLGAAPDEIVFTGGGSESDNLAIKGVVLTTLPRHPHVISTAIEHPAVRTTLAYLARRFGVDHTVLSVDEYGMVSPEAVRQALRPETVLVSVMHANNEVGTLQPLAEIARLTREAGVLFHTDAAQSAGKIDVDVAALGVDLLTLAGHKLYAPKGVGALYVRRGVTLDPLVHGSGQEQGLRAGTENVAALVALGKACELARADLAGETLRLTSLRDRLHLCLESRIPGLQLNGHPTQRLPNTLNVSVPGAEGSAVLACSPGVAASTGSACHSGLSEPSSVLLAMGPAGGRARGALRLSVGRWSTDSEVERAADLVGKGYTTVRGLTPSFR